MIFPHSVPSSIQVQCTKERKKRLSHRWGGGGGCEIHVLFKLDLELRVEPYVVLTYVTLNQVMYEEA